MLPCSSCPIGPLAPIGPGWVLILLPSPRALWSSLINLTDLHSVALWAGQMMDVIHVFKCSLMSGFQATSLVRKFVDSSSGCPVSFQGTSCSFPSQGVASIFFGAVSLQQLAPIGKPWSASTPRWGTCWPPSWAGCRWRWTSPGRTSWSSGRRTPPRWRSSWSPWPCGRPPSLSSGIRIEREVREGEEIVLKKPNFNF